jgi:hypothetical protein
MITESEFRDATQAGDDFKQAILKASYGRENDRLIFLTPWGVFAIDRATIPEFKAATPGDLEKIYVSHTGVHIDELDIDINSAGLLTAIFDNIRSKLSNSY